VKTHIAITREKAKFLRPFAALSFSIAILIVGGISASRSQEPQPHRAQAAQQPTPSQREIEHSKLYSKYSAMDDLRATAAKSGRDVEVLIGTPQKAFRTDQPPLQLADYVAEISNKADAVVIGEVSGEQSFLTAEGTFVFTDYAFNIADVLKNNPASQLSATDTIIVTRPGGTVRFGNRNIKTLDEAVEPFDLRGRYLLFLEYVPTTGAYKAFSSNGAFRLESGRAAKVTKERLPFELENGSDLQTLISHIRAAVH
jgi:hypothetical protein